MTADLTGLEPEAWVPSNPRLVQAAVGLRVGVLKLEAEQLGMVEVERLPGVGTSRTEILWCNKALPHADVMSETWAIMLVLRAGGHLLETWPLTMGVEEIEDVDLLLAAIEDNLGEGAAHVTPMVGEVLLMNSHRVHALSICDDGEDLVFAAVHLGADGPRPTRNEAETLLLKALDGP